jgi:hypothetical protein
MPRRRFSPTIGLQYIRRGGGNTPGGRSAGAAAGNPVEPPLPVGDVPDEPQHWIVIATSVTGHVMRDRRLPFRCAPPSAVEPPPGSRRRRSIGRVSADAVGDSFAAARTPGAASGPRALR